MQKPCTLVPTPKKNHFPELLSAMGQQWAIVLRHCPQVPIEFHFECVLDVISISKRWKWSLELEEPPRTGVESEDEGDGKNLVWQRVSGVFPKLHPRSNCFRFHYSDRITTRLDQARLQTLSCRACRASSPARNHVEFRIGIRLPGKNNPAQSMNDNKPSNTWHSPRSVCCGESRERMAALSSDPPAHALSVSPCGETSRAFSLKQAKGRLRKKSESNCQWFRSRMISES